MPGQAYVLADTAYALRVTLLPGTPDIVAITPKPIPEYPPHG